MLSRAKLKEALESAAFSDPDIVIKDDVRGLIAYVVAKDFEGVTDSKRQEKVWSHLRSYLGDEGVRGVQFVFTFTPDEYRSDQESTSP